VIVDYVLDVDFDVPTEYEVWSQRFGRWCDLKSCSEMHEEGIKNILIQRPHLGIQTVLHLWLSECSSCKCAMKR
jgi:hypothetical protein